MKIGIVGAGIIGKLLAYALVNNGHHVSVYDQDSDFGKSSCSIAAAGLLTPISELYKSEYIIYELGVESLSELWPKIIDSLDKNIYFKRMGSLIVSHPKDQPELLNFVSIIDVKMKNKGLITVFNQLNKNELLALEPELLKFSDGYYLSEEGQIDNQTVLDKLNIYLSERNIQWYLNTHVTQITSHEIMTESDVHSYELVFDCRGLGAKTVFSDLHPVRGELLWLHAPEVNIQRPIRFMHPRYGLYIVPRDNNYYIIGASEIYTDDYSDISVRSCLELLTSAYYVHPAFAEARIVKTITHCRPTLSNHLPKIKCMNTCVAINGLYRHGYLIAPALVEDVMRWMSHGKLGLRYPQLWEFE